VLERLVGVHRERGGHGELLVSRLQRTVQPLGDDVGQPQGRHQRLELGVVQQQADAVQVLPWGLVGVNAVSPVRVEPLPHFLNHAGFALGRAGVVLAVKDAGQHCPHCARVSGWNGRVGRGHAELVQDRCGDGGRLGAEPIACEALKAQLDVEYEILDRDHALAVQHPRSADRAPQL
jgi:hypothetical protein